MCIELVLNGGPLRPKNLWLLGWDPISSGPVYLRHLYLCHPSHGQIDSPSPRQSPFEEQGGYTWIDTIYAMESESRVPTQHDHVAGIEAEGAGGIAAVAPAQAEQTGIAEQSRD
jgi:hypothetical protein